VAADPDAFLQLSDAELVALEQIGARRAVKAGEYLYREGDSSYDFYVILSGAVEIVVTGHRPPRCRRVSR
jgi:thioredoxin reductase (NADPH)